MFNQQIEFSQFEKKLKEAVLQTKEAVFTIRTGKVSPSLVENIMVEAYQGQSKLKLMELASIITSRPSTLLVTPFDPTVIPDIEKAIISSPLNLSPRVEKEKIYIQVPPLTEEQRQKFLKLICQKVEEGRENIRIVRDEIRKKVKIAYEADELTEDDKYRIEKQIDETTQIYNSQLEDLKKRKEKEIIEI